MKKLNFVLSLSAVAVCVISCQKSFSINDAVDEQPKVGYVEPLCFSSAEDLRTAVENLKESGFPTKSSEGFVSYLETVMQEDGYDDKPNAIYSESFGSILNPDGEVVFGDYMLKIVDNGILFSNVDNVNTIRFLACCGCLLENLMPASSCPLSLNDPEKIYVVDKYADMYLYDSFGIIEDYKTLKTKGDAKYFEFNETSKTLFWTGSKYSWNKAFTFPKGEDQKYVFPTDNKIANDTKIYQRDLGVYKETGVKTKTMKKGFLGIWNKFDALVTSAIVGLTAKEEWAEMNFNSALSGLIDISYVTYSSNQYVVATFKVGDDIMNSPVDKSFAGMKKTAEDFAKKKGKTVNVNAIRYVGNNKNYAIVVFPDNIVTKTDSKNTIMLDLDFGNKKYSIGNLIVASDEEINKEISSQMRNRTNYYYINTVGMYGNSEYGGNIRGSNLFYTLSL